jgi:LuxR family maltose regulon positive regulatory protein
MRTQQHDTSDVLQVELLQTKLAPPRLRGPLVARPALLDRLDAGRDRKLTLITAPAGFGKTTLVAAWLERLAAQPRSCAAAWVTLDERDNDPGRFWR